MTRKTHIIAACVLLGIGVLLAVPLVLRMDSPRGWLDDHYQRVSHDARTDSTVYSSRRPASSVVKAVAGRFDPYERLNDPTGYYLRYSDLIVRISARAGGGSTIRAVEPHHGYHLWGPVIIGSWGTFHGRGPSFRGGGPGAGK